MKEDERNLMFRARQAALGKSIRIVDTHWGFKSIEFGQTQDVEKLARCFAGKKRKTR
ncbi:hypothetical protein [Desulfosporosinus sp. OT]|uniref:hypothetical protein n=1 Tax=Desulfosporosinus sp. OT TaxID=913865 RepID=UPI00030A281C|nr:hypothetical protein [Desulfosporosinus sp. OT]